MKSIVDAQDSDGKTALHLALANDQEQWMRAEKIMKMSPSNYTNHVDDVFHILPFTDPSLKDNEQKNCLHIAFEHSAPGSIVGHLLMKG